MFHLLQLMQNYMYQMFLCQFKKVQNCYKFRMNTLLKQRLFSSNYSSSNYNNIIDSVSGQLPSEKNCPPGRVGVLIKVRVSFSGVWVKVSLSFRVGGQPDNYSRGKFPPWLGLGFSLGLVLVLGGAIFLEGNCP